MKKCPECGKEFKNLGAHMKAHRGEDGVQEGVQEGQDRPQRPLDRFRTNAVFPGCVGFRHVIR